MLVYLPVEFGSSYIGSKDDSCYFSSIRHSDTGWNSMNKNRKLNYCGFSRIQKNFDPCDSSLLKHNGVVWDTPLYPGRFGFISDWFPEHKGEYLFHSIDYYERSYQPNDHDVNFYLYWFFDKNGTSLIFRSKKIIGSFYPRTDQVDFYDFKYEFIKQQVKSLNITVHNCSDTKIIKNTGRKPKFDNNTIQDIKNRLLNGSSYRSLSKEFGCSLGYISKIVNEH